MIQKMKKIEKKEHGFKLNLFFLVIFIFFLLSLGTFIYGMLKSNRFLKEKSEIGLKEKEIEFETDEESLSKYFEKTKNTNETGTDKYILNDPFLNQCLDSSGDNLPSINANTVCLR